MISQVIKSEAKTIVKLKNDLFDVRVDCEGMAILLLPFESCFVVDLFD